VVVVVRRLTIAILVVVSGTLIPALPAQAESRAFLAKPSGITCVGSRLGQSGAAVRCDLPFLGRRAVFLHTSGKATIAQVSAFAHPSRPPTLGRGKELRLGQFSCTSLKAAVTCRSGSGHGFTVGSEFQLTF
jgi:hypothetical protein